MITLYGFGRVHEKVIGETRDLRAQWALEETGLPYRVQPLDHTGGETSTEDYRRLSPFQQIPVIDNYVAWIDFFGGKDPTGENRAWFLKWTQRVLTSLEKRLDGREYIACEDFTVADILMTLVLWEIRKTDLLDGVPKLKEYFLRCQDRPAWERTRRAYEERLHVPRGTVQ